VWLPGKLHAQHVLYTESFHTRTSTHIQVIGKSGDFYWIEKLQKQKTNGRRNAPGLTGIQSVGLLDASLHVLAEYPVTQVPGTLKQWLVCNKEGLDQIFAVRSAGITKIIRNHFTTDQWSDTKPAIIDSLPFSTDPSRLLLVRSEDQSKILLVAFEDTDPDSTRVHAMLYNADWSTIYHRSFNDEQFSQPCIQDDEIGFPAESFDNLPIKLANNGEWLMAYPSRISHNFCVFHAGSKGSDHQFREITLSPFYKMEDIAMSIDNTLQEMSLGLLSALPNSSFKNVQICKYSIERQKFYFDSSYHFNTQFRNGPRKNLSHESFVAVPGAGYLLMIEYGIPHEFENPLQPVYHNWEAAFLMTNYSEAPDENEPLKNGYTLRRGLHPIPFVRNRGDLNLFYFPAISKDSVWSGMLDIEQHAEANNPDLSYLLMPAGGKFYMIYNHFEGGTDPLATATTLNTHGQSSEEPLVFWRMDRVLNFQRARRFTANEVAVPYRDNQQDGFAVIHLY
jgi:hypothetical protein